MVETSFGLDGSGRSPPRDAFCRLDFVPTEDIDIGAVIGTAPAPRARARMVRNALIVELLLSAWRDSNLWLAYSRDRNFYSERRRYFGPTASFQMMMAAVESLVKAKLVEHQKTRPGSNRRFKSRMRPKSRLLQASPITHVGQLRRSIFEPIRLKDDRRQLREYAATPETRGWRNDAHEQNEALRGLQIAIEAGSLTSDRHGLLHSDGNVLNPARDQCYRVFNRDFNHGGRWYGLWWQSIGAHKRSQIRINGEVVVELDYAHLHPTLLAAMIGIDLGVEDPYIVDNVPRKLSKKVFNVLLNADTGEAALRALQRELTPEADERPRQYAIRLVNAVKARHPSFTDYWGSGMGRRLQCIDGHICAEVQRRMRESGSPVLSVHDSFIVATNKKSLLEEVMADVLEQAKDRLENGTEKCM